MAVDAPTPREVNQDADAAGEVRLRQQEAGSWFMFLKAGRRRFGDPRGLSIKSLH